MTSDQIAAVYQSVLSGLSEITVLFGANIATVITILGCVAIMGIFAIMIKALYSAFGIKNIP